MKLTKSQRFTAYCIMLAELELTYEMKDSNEKRLCHVIYHVFGVDNAGFCKSWNGEWYWQAVDSNSGINHVIDHHFQELNNKKPKTGWPFKTDLSGINKRKELLKQCILETHP